MLLFQYWQQIICVMGRNDFNARVFNRHRSALFTKWLCTAFYTCLFMFCSTVTTRSDAIQVLYNGPCMAAPLFALPPIIVNGLKCMPHINTTYQFYPWPDMCLMCVSLTIPGVKQQCILYNNFSILNPTLLQNCITYSATQCHFPLECYDNIVIVECSLCVTAAPGGADVPEGGDHRPDEPPPAGHGSTRPTGETGGQGHVGAPEADARRRGSPPGTGPTL